MTDPIDLNQRESNYDKATRHFVNSRMESADNIVKYLKEECAYKLDYLTNFEVKLDDDNAGAADGADLAVLERIKAQLLDKAAKQQQRKRKASSTTAGHDDDAELARKEKEYRERADRLQRRVQAMRDLLMDL